MGAIKTILGIGYQTLSALGDRLTYRKDVDFSTWVSQSEAGFEDKRGNQYQPSSISTLRRALSRYTIRETDALIDIGCGKGKVMCVCARYPFRRIRGLELSPALAEIARRNIRTLGLRQCEVAVGDAACYTDYDDFTFFYMFNPFPEEVFRAAIRNIAASLARCPRKCVLLYMNPVHHAVVEAESPFRLRRTVKAAAVWFSCNCYEFDPDAP